MPACTHARTHARIRITHAAADRGPLRFCAPEAGSQASLSAQLRARVRARGRPCRRPPLRRFKCLASPPTPCVAEVSVSRAEAVGCGGRRRGAAVGSEAEQHHNF